MIHFKIFVWILTQNCDVNHGINIANKKTSETQLMTTETYHIGK